MTNTKAGPDAAGIPQQIIEQFLTQLTAEKISPDIVARLKKTLLDASVLGKSDPVVFC